MKNTNKNKICYCGSQESFEACCHPLIAGTLTPEKPEQLMRSRYSAFCIKDIEYLVSTHHPSKRQPDERDVLAKTINETHWLGLKVLGADTSQLSQGIGYVEFAAFYKNIEEGHLHENSKFVYENDQWYYFDGMILDPLKFKRNEICWCGSMKKFKKCHGK